MQIPNEDDIRYPEGAPVVIYAEGGFEADGLPNKKIPGLNDMIVITFIYPGGENTVQKAKSDGEYYDYRGEKSIEALCDIILYAAGKLKDSKGKAKWFKINPDPEYIIEVNSTLGEEGIFIPDVQPNTKPNNWEDIKSYCIPELVKDETYQIAAIHQMADRVHSG